MQNTKKIIALIQHKTQEIPFNMQKIRSCFQLRIPEVTEVTEQTFKDHYPEIWKENETKLKELLALIKTYEGNSANADKYLIAAAEISSKAEGKENKSFTELITSPECFDDFERRALDYVMEKGGGDSGSKWQKKP